MNVRTAFSEKFMLDEALPEIRAPFKGQDLSAGIFFASSCFDPFTVAKELQGAFPRARIFGCSTAGEIVTGRMLNNSLVFMGFPREVLPEVALSVVHPLDGKDLRTSVAKALDHLASQLGLSLAELDEEKHVGIVLVDGLSAGEERLMDILGDLTNILFVGGSAGDDMDFRGTFLYADGETHSNAAVLAILRPAKGFGFVKTQSFTPTGKKLVATIVNEPARQVLTFDGKPAAQAYAEAIGVPVDLAPASFMRFPLGFRSGGELYVRSPMRIAEGHLYFFCQVKEGMELEILEAGDMITDTRNALQAEIQRLGSASGVINFHCILRTFDLLSRGLTEEYGKVFTDIPTVGFSTYGEEFIGHINQTATMLVLR